MKPRCLRLIHLVVGSLIGPLLNAQETSSVSAAVRNDSKARSAINALVREDIRKSSVIRSTDAEEVAVDRGEKAADVDPDDVVMLERLVVQDEKIRMLIAPRESPLAKILRTGTIKQHVGKKITTRLWTSGDAGIVLSFRR